MGNSQETNVNIRIDPFATLVPKLQSVAILAQAILAQGFGSSVPPY
jgi:hypothetical protein